MFDLTKNVDYTFIVALEVAPPLGVRLFSSTDDEVVRVLISANVTRLIASTVCVSRVEIMEERSCLAGLFDRLPSAADIHSYRRRFAQELYELIAGRPLPPYEGRLHAADFDRSAAEYVSKCLGHNRVDIIFGSYIR